MSVFEYSPSLHVPFRDKEALERCRKISRAEIDKHPNPEYHITVMKDTEIEFRWIADMLCRIKTAADAHERLVMILPNPWPSFARLAYLINRLRIDCRLLHLVAMDEFANEHGDVAPRTWRNGLVHAMLNYLYYEIDEDLRPPENQVHGPTTENLKDYGKLLEDVGGGDIVYTGPGWTGHICYIEPGAEEFRGSFEEWKKMGPRIITLNPFSIAQQSLHGDFGMSGDIAAIPPKGATIGPAQIIAAGNRIDIHAITIHSTATSWQRMITRLCLHGPVTSLVPTSLLQTLRTDVWVSESIAQDIEPDYEKGY
jgi:6-phosphogluconolactonase/glucosamine-6-phosphate isomerase/deaminase